MTGLAYVMDWEAIDNGLDEWFLGRTYHPRVCPSDAAYNDDSKPQPAAHFCDASACTPRVVNTEFLPLDEFNDLLLDLDDDGSLFPGLYFDGWEFGDLDTVNGELADLESKVLALGYSNGVVEFIRV